MNKIIILVTVLIVQLGIIFYLNFDKKTISTTRLLTSNLKVINKFEIHADKKHLTFSKKDNNWFLDNYNRIEVEPSKIKSLINELEQINTGEIVGDTLQSAKNLNLTEGNYLKEIKIFKDDKTSENLLFGKSNGFKRVFVKKDNNKEIFDIKFNDELNVNPNFWVKKDLLKISGEFKSLKINDIALIVKDGIWASANNSNLIQEEVNKFIAKLSSIGFESVEFETNEVEFNKIEKFLNFVLTADQEISFDFRGPYETDYLLLKVSKYPFIFKVLKNKIDGIKETKLKNLG